LATKGKPHRVDNSVSQIIASPLRKHSQKPEEARDKIVSLLGGVLRKLNFLRARERWAGMPGGMRLRVILIYQKEDSNGWL
jgi:site-specific DNA-methyltransferase (adenine-specific)